MQSVDVWLTTSSSRSVVEEGLNPPCLQSTTTPHPDWKPFDAQRESALRPAIPEIKSLVRRSTNFWDLGKEGDEREGGFPSHVMKSRQQRLPFPPIATMQAQRPQENPCESKKQRASAINSRVDRQGSPTGHSGRPPPIPCLLLRQRPKVASRYDNFALVQAGNRLVLSHRRDQAAKPSVGNHLVPWRVHETPLLLHLRVSYSNGRVPPIRWDAGCSIQRLSAPSLY